jgi:hypothetical protein
MNECSAPEIPAAQCNNIPGTLNICQQCCEKQTSLNLARSDQLNEMPAYAYTVAQLATSRILMPLY